MAEIKNVEAETLCRLDELVNEALDDGWDRVEGTKGIVVTDYRYNIDKATFWQTLEKTTP